MRKWNIVDELRTQEAVVGFMAAVFAREHTNEEVCQAIDIASKAIAAHNLALETSAAEPLAADA